MNCATLSTPSRREQSPRCFCWIATEYGCGQWLGRKALKTWKEEIDSLEAGPYAGFCSTGGDHARALTVGDIHSDPLFTVHRDAALREGLQMASFRPILSIEKQILGALALSYPDRATWPKPDAEMIERAVHLAAI